MRLFNFFLRMTGDRAGGEDLVQEVFVRMLKYRKSFRARGEFSAWMFALARNVSADYFGRRGRARPAATRSSRSGRAAGPLPLEQLEMAESIERLRAPCSSCRTRSASCCC